uniref:BAG domain-containing protein n=1 Tax=Panagrolaimus sp. JU765 TaxID=591449 RepID=A0AC34QL18_9BILA
MVEDVLRHSSGVLLADFAMTKSGKSQKKDSKEQIKNLGSNQNAEKKNEANDKEKDDKLRVRKLPRQMIRVQRSEPNDGIVRNELRFVSYVSKTDVGQAPVEMHVVSEAFTALVSRLRELDVTLPGVEQNVNLAKNGANGVDQSAFQAEIDNLKDKLAASQQECERLRRSLDEICMAANDSSMITSQNEPDWVRQTENQIKAVTDQLNPIHSQAQRFGPLLSDLKAHLRQILDEIQDRRIKGQLGDERFKQQIRNKIEKCHKVAAESVKRH